LDVESNGEILMKRYALMGFGGDDLRQLADNLVWGGTGTI